MTKSPTLGRPVVLVDGVRTPFRRSGSDYIGLTTYDLARDALAGILERTNLSPEAVEYVSMGTVMPSALNPNIARDAMLGASIPQHIPAHSISMACISANRAITSVANMIALGQYDVALAGGVEVLSDVPVGFKKEVRRKFFESRRYKNSLEYRKFLQGLSLKDYIPQAPAIAEFTSGETMGESADRLASNFGISREAQDAYALRSHQCAAQAAEDGHLDDIIPVTVAPKYNVIDKDNTYRADSSMEKLAKLRAAFNKPFGNVTAGNASPLTDGASAALIMSEERAKADGYAPKAYLRAHTFVGSDPAEELLLGPAYATPRVLAQAGLTLADMDVIEIHEAFAGQVLAVVSALESDEFAKTHLNQSSAVGKVDMDKVNCWGGSLSLGHPFGATGTRLVTMAANRLRAEGGRYALVTACAAGGLGHAMIVENYEVN